MKGSFLIMFAVFIDSLQLLMGIGLMAMQALPVIGQAAIPLAGGLAAVIGFTLGAGLITAIIFSGYFSWGAILGGSAAEIFPLADMIIPGWTLLTWRCISAAHAKEAAKKKKEVSARITQTLAPQPFSDIRAAHEKTYAQQAAA